MVNADLLSYQSLYIQKAKERLEELMQAVVDLSSGNTSDELIKKMHICAHAMKGQAQLMGHSQISSTSGMLEDLLVSIQEGKRSFDVGVIDFVKLVVDTLVKEISGLEQNTQPATVSLNANTNGAKSSAFFSILLIEDDPFIRQFYAVKLQEKQLQVDVAVDGEEGMTKIRSKKPDVVLLDLIMPKKDGFSVLKDLSSDPALAKIPVIVFSTLGQEQDVEKAKQMGAKDYIEKSFFDLEKLLGKIKEVTKKY